MTTREHLAILMWVLTNEENGDVKKATKKFKGMLPYALLPDGIRAYVGDRQRGHFEKNPDGTDVSWMEYPAPDVLKSLSKETASIMVKSYKADGYKPCCIGEDTDISVFDDHNKDNQFFHELRIHLRQDVVLDRILRENMVDCSGRFEGKFVPYHDASTVLDDGVVRKQIALFQKLGFIDMVGKIFGYTGVLISGDWMNENVLKPLLEVYPPDLAMSTYKFIKYDEEMDSRISGHNFTISDEEKASIKITDKFDEIVAKLYGEAYDETRDEIRSM